MDMNQDVWLTDSPFYGTAAIFSQAFQRIPRQRYQMLVPKAAWCEKYHHELIALLPLASFNLVDVVAFIPAGLTENKT